MLKASLLTLRGGFELALAIGAILVLVDARPGARRMVLLGLVAGLAASVTVAYLFLDQFNRQLLDLWLQLAASIGVLFIIGTTPMFTMFSSGGAHPRNMGNVGVVPRFLIGLSVVAITMARGIDLALFPRLIFLQTAAFVTSEMMVKATAAVFGLVFSLIFGLVFRRATRNLSASGLRLSALLILMLLLAGQLSVALQMAVVTGILAPSPGLMALVVRLVNLRPLLIYGLLSAATAVFVLGLFYSRKVGRLAANPAAARKALAAVRRQRRWSLAVGAGVTIVAFLVATETVFAEREVELSPAKRVTAGPDGKIKIAGAEIDDGRLHRFSFTTKQGTGMRFIAAYKGSEVFGVGLDACETCGIVGYYQQGRNVICKNCGSAIDVATIGFPGGCNPRPLPSTVEGKALVIRSSDLEAKEEVWR